MNDSKRAVAKQSAYDATGSGGELPLAGIRVLEFAHMAMGPSCGMILADLGAEVIKVEPQGIGDKTRYLGSHAVGFHCVFNRNKKSIAIDYKSDQGKAAILELIKSADVLTENFRDGALERQGMGYEALKQINPRLIYCSLKGFLSGPYQHRTALDEVVQMMGGLAYMTGPPGKPSRAGASVNDIMGGMFGVIGILSALVKRQATGKGGFVRAALFENCALLMAQHIAKFQLTGEPSQSLFQRKESPWPVYDLFGTKDGQQVFLALVTDSQWRLFCSEFELVDLLDDPILQDNLNRVFARDRIQSRVGAIFAQLSMEKIVDRLERVGCPYAPVAKPEDLLEDVHLNQPNGFLPVEVEPGRIGKIPGLPLEYDGQRPPLRLQPPVVGEHSWEVMKSVGYSESELAQLVESKLLTISSRDPDVCLPQQNPEKPNEPGGTDGYG